MKTKNKFSPRYIDALAQCITGGSASYNAPPGVGKYRSGQKIVEFFRSLGYDVIYGDWSRVPFTNDLLISINFQEDGFDKITQITEKLLDPRDYIDHEDKLNEVVNYLNQHLTYDDLEIVKLGEQYRLVKRATTIPAVEQFGTVANQLSLQNVKADFERALKRIDSDPSGAITSVCSTLESLAKSILDDRAVDYPKNQSIQPLLTATISELRLAPDQAAEAELKRILGSLLNVVAGIGVLRTKYGDAHGRGKAYKQLSARHARLAVNAASTLGLFLLESHLGVK